jgi:hypothetical protein
MINRAACCVSTLVLMAVALPALAVNDFNSSRSNREKGTLVVSPPAPGASAGDEEAQAVQQAQDFNTTRSNKERGATKTTHVHGDPHVDQITIDEGGVHRGSSSKRVLPTVNKRTTAADGPDQDCDGVACPAATPVSSSVKGGKTGHVTLNR